MAISDFVLLHKKAGEALAKSDCVGFDFISSIAELKTQVLKYAKPYERRLQSIIPTFRVAPSGSGEDPTTVSARAKRKTFVPMNIEMQFIEKHKILYRTLIAI